MPDELSQPLENSSRDIENGLTLEWFLQNDELGSFRDGFGEIRLWSDWPNVLSGL